MFLNERAYTFSWFAFGSPVKNLHTQIVFRALFVICVPQDIKFLSAYFLIPVGLICRVNNLTAQIRGVISITTKTLEENFCSKREQPKNLVSHIIGVFRIVEAEWE